MNFFKKIIFYSPFIGLFILQQIVHAKPVIRHLNQNAVHILPVMPAPDLETDSVSYKIYNGLIMGKYPSDFADINVADNTGKTALMYAAINGNYLVSKMLVEYGATIDAIDIYGKTALMYALSPHGYWLPRKEEYIKIIELLLQYGANVMQTDKNGTTLINMAVRTHGQNSQVVKLLEQYGAYFDPYAYTVEPAPQIQIEPYLLKAQDLIY